MIIALDNIRSQYNVGSIFRTLDGAFGNKCKLFLGGNTPTPKEKDVNKTALGAEQNVPWEKINNLEEKIKEIKEKKYTIIGIEENKISKPYKNYIDQIKENKNIVIIFGAETTGISKELLNLCDLILHLPMNGVKNSLNVASTVAIVSYLFILSNLQEQ